MFNFTNYDGTIADNYAFAWTPDLVVGRSVGPLTLDGNVSHVPITGFALTDASPRVLITAASLLANDTALNPGNLRLSAVAS